jgi:hypothetical protein
MRFGDAALTVCQPFGTQQRNSMPYMPAGITPPRRPLMALAAIAAAAIAGPVATASAGGNAAPGSVGSTCSLSQPFAGLGDGTTYTLTGNGSLEQGSAAWLFGGGARVVNGDDPFDLTAGRDQHALSLPNGSVANNLVTCMVNLQPPLRFAAVNSGDPNATLQVSALTGDPMNPTVTPIASVTAGSTWQVVAPIQFSVPQTGGLGFRFTPTGGAWQIDDVYVDPFKTR